MNKKMSGKIKILIVEHDPNDIELIQYELKKGGIIYISEIVQNEKEYDNALKNFIPDIILSDYSIPSFSGLAAFEIKEKISPLTPFIFVSGTIGEENSIELIKNGVTDFVLKDKLFSLTIKVKRALKEAQEKEQKIETDEKLKKSEAKFRQLMESSTDALIGANKEGKIVYANKEATILFGYSTDELLNNKIEMLLPGRFRERHEGYRTGFQANPVTREMGKAGLPLYGRRKDESEFATEISLKSIETEEGLVVMSVIRNITEKKKAEENLKQSENRFRELFESAPESLVVVDNTTLTFVKFNANAVKLFKYSAEEFIKIGPLDISPLFQPDGRLSEEKAKEFMINLMKGDNPVFEWLVVDANGKEIICEVRLTLLSNINESQHLASFIDITERKNTEKKIEQQNKELAASNMELEQFAYVASHDLQEPLRMVSSFLNLVEKRMDGQLDDTSRQYIHFAVDGAKRMKTLIQDLLLYSRVDTNKENFTATDLNDVMQYVNHLLEEDIKKNRAVITVKPMPVISANKTLISQLFVNLVSNALKYHGDKEPEIEVGCTEEPGKWIFYVKDNGIGIDPKFFDKIFIIFQRLHTKNEYSGTGIGLAICKKIVETHKGRIWVESEAGKGSTFYFSIPKQNV